MSESSLVGIGLYTVAEAAQLTHASSTNIRRWVFGYKYSYKGQDRVASPLWKRQLRSEFDHDGIGFRDLIELRFVKAFRDAKISLQAIRLASQRAREIFQAERPFSSKRFFTDGRTIFAEITGEIDEPRVVDLIRNQYAFRQVIRPELYKSMEFSNEAEATRWYPEWPNRQIVIDPARNFGKPILSKHGVPTAALSAAYNAERSLRAVAHQFEVPLDQVKRAVAFESRIAH